MKQTHNQILKVHIHPGNHELPVLILNAMFDTKASDVVRDGILKLYCTHMKRIFVMVHPSQYVVDRTRV